MIENIKFIRFGGLSALKQEHYKPNDVYFHNPPVKRGFYAFPHFYEEFFLLGATNNPSHISGKSAWLKDENNNLLIYNEHINFTDFDKRTGKDNYEYSEKLTKLCKKYNIEKKYLHSSVKNDIQYICYYKKPRIFEYTGEIWHHLYEGLSPSEILLTKKSWVLSTYNDYVKAFNKINHKDAKQIFSSNYGGENTMFHTYISEMNLKKIDAYNILPICKDHLEVFIEKL